MFALFFALQHLLKASFRSLLYPKKTSILNGAPIHYNGVFLPFAAFWTRAYRYLSRGVAFCAASVPSPGWSPTSRGMSVFLWYHCLWTNYVHVWIKETISLKPTALFPQVFWLKNDKMLDVKNLVGYIITNEGNLIISQAKLSDTGEGKCQS